MMKHFMAAEVAAPTSTLCGEAPLWDPVSRSIYWTDCTGAEFIQYRPASGVWQVLSRGIEIYGFRKRRGGGFVITNLSGVWLWDGRENLRPVVREIAGKPCQANDCTADSRGRLITATFYYCPGTDYELGLLFSVCPGGEVRLLDEGFHLANGIALSPDEQTLYVTDSAARRIYAYDYDVQSGQARNRRVLIQVPPDEGIPDGLVVDSEGCLWSAQWYGGCVAGYDPGGELLARLPLPAKQVSSVTFGGDTLTDLYITTAARSEPMPLMPPGYDPETGPFGGPLYRIPGMTPGLPAQEAEIRA
jgi:D-xylonolactonase